MEIIITTIEATEFSQGYKEAELKNAPAMTIAELDLLTEQLGVDVLVF